MINRNFQKIETLIPFNNIEINAQQQIFTIIKYDIVKKFVIMPDIHAGYYMPIGCAALVENYISPQMVGRDIGCGMIYLDTNICISDIIKSDTDRINIYNEIKEKVPCGIGKNLSKLKDNLNFNFKSGSGDKELNTLINNKINYQIGTLGHGNHFIELGITKNNTLGITIHTGSRNSGSVIADFYIKKALNNYFEYNSELGQAYYIDMKYMIHYASSNRMEILNQILNILNLKLKPFEKQIIQCIHNYAIDIWNNEILHRKGCISAELDQYGIIPGNMRDGVYIVKGLGNNQYLNTASHGAGRKMARSEAKQNTDLKEFEEMMIGITCETNKHNLDENPTAYKNIKNVIKFQENVVINVVDFVKPIINIKG